MTPALANLGQVAPGYVHRDKLITPGPALVLPEAILKWYEVALPDAPISEEVRELARACLLRPEIAQTYAGDLGFVILHRCGGGDFYFLLPSTWRGENELWESVFAKAGPHCAEFRPFEFTTHHRGTFCVWELGVVWHEQQAWRRFLRSARDETSKRDYLADTITGVV